ncbi:MAG: hypothetical protein ACQETQ_05385 [Spirochaetota bacterium]
MKKRILIVAILAIMVGGFLGAQEAQNNNDSELFVHTIYLNQVFRHRLGFKVTYTADNLDFQEKYIPSSWFNSAAGKGDLVETGSKSAPYMDVYFRNGEFSHVRLFVRDNPDHVSWGRLGNEANTQENFDVETLEL